MITQLSSSLQQAVGPRLRRAASLVMPRLIFDTGGENDVARPWDHWWLKVYVSIYTCWFRALTVADRCPAFGNRRKQGSNNNNLPQRMKSTKVKMHYSKNKQTQTTQRIFPKRSVPLHASNDASTISRPGGVGVPLLPSGREDQGFDSRCVGFFLRSLQNVYMSASHFRLYRLQHCLHFVKIYRHL